MFCHQCTSTVLTATNHFIVTISIANEITFGNTYNSCPIPVVCYLVKGYYPIISAHNRSLSLYKLRRKKSSAADISLLGPRLHPLPLLFPFLWKMKVKEQRFVSNTFTHVFHFDYIAAITTAIAEAELYQTVRGAFLSSRCAITFAL